MSFLLDLSVGNLLLKLENIAPVGRIRRLRRIRHETINTLSTICSVWHRSSLFPAYPCPISHFPFPASSLPCHLSDTLLS
ncbi:hypothetical protein D6V68_15925 [Escherichia albertii]|nr:hypothetical protein [Escherichia albertii]EFO0110136.1 hypothetical protein [Escherichia albertii]EFO0321909.1 hypothetical protein [Escherichia albertii]MLY52286.1 hypothetical protein [Escherichia albertii]PPQ51171.1 hypothetical protein C4623_21010 [Escherichia albertii]